MNRLIKLFTEHPHSVNENYFQHLLFTLYIGIAIILTGFVCIVHGFFPFIFKTYTSTKISALAEKLNQRKK